ncbi:hypothetical protein NYR55_07550 [Sphingomonas sp. BGYR3]|uniref:hypothetical protein n=1 Tax=Sphingomonas sp. BGYR3 TaxID=2975483 RepID=UPI0021A2BA14|nr:hypothetical protein [Sphingomonas sp. BGYR3]MDG5488468.1 hypothetical protein [Sphingomonas sp. BGYR3]
MIRTALILATLTLAACSPQTPQEKQADQLRDEAAARAESVMAEAGNVTAGMESQAEALMNEAGQMGTYEAKRLQVRADALKREADVVTEQAEAKARAIKAEGEAKASAILAQ